MTDDQLLRFADQLNALGRAAGVVWRQYGQVGPGKVDGRLFEPVAAAADALMASAGDGGTAAAGDRLGVDGSAWSDELNGKVAKLLDLSKRCACTRLGLCFLAPEKGFIRRPDLHAAFAESLAWVEQQAKLLREAIDEAADP